MKAFLLFILPLSCADAGPIFSSWASFVQDQQTAPGDLAFVLPNRKLQKLDPINVYPIKSADFGSLTFYCSNRRAGDNSGGSYLVVTLLLFYNPTNQNLTPIGAVREPELYLRRNDKWREQENGDLRKWEASAGVNNISLDGFIGRNQPESASKNPFTVIEHHTFRSVPWHAFPMHSTLSSAADISTFLYPSAVDPKTVAARLSLKSESPFKIEALLLSFRESNEPATENVLKFEFNRKGADGAFILTGSRESPEYNRQYYIRFPEK